MRDVTVTLTIEEAREVLRAAERMIDYPRGDWMTPLESGIGKIEKAISE